MAPPFCPAHAPGLLQFGMFLSDCSDSARLRCVPVEVPGVAVFSVRPILSLDSVLTDCSFPLVGEQERWTEKKANGESACSR